MKISPQHIFGWNSEVWNRTFISSNEVRKILARKNLKVLEIGAGIKSQIAFVFDATESDITIGYYDIKNSCNLEKIVDKKIKNFDLVSQYEVKFIDAFNLNQKYDVIILKSVLGGIFRGNDFSKAEEFCHEIVRKNLNKNGALITIDNGQSIFEMFLKNFGARNNNWHFTTLDELLTADEKVGFGLISAFSFSTRLGIVGFKIEKLLYYVDIFLYSLIKSKPTVICSIFKKNSSM
ncbi:hypothetical protein N9E46_01335 [Gammaproteobacteria bacterium]|nr:hypothetical protein [Gammaproteobacteria bacterium]